MQKLYLIILFISVFSYSAYSDSDFVSSSQLYKSDGTTRIDLLIKLSKQFRNSNSDSSFYYARKALSEAQSIKYDYGIAEAFRYIALIHFNIGDYHKSVDTLEIALPIYKKINDDSGIANCLKQIGDSYLRLADFDRALNLYHRSLKIFDRITNSDDNILKYKSGLYNSLGFLNRQIDNREQAIGYFKKALSIDRKIKNFNGMMATYINLGLIYYDNKEYEQSLEYNLKAYNLGIKVENYRLLLTATNNLGRTYMNLGAYDKAISCLMESYSISEKFEDKNALFRTMFIIAEVYENSGDYEGAMNHLKQSLDIALEINARNDLPIIYLKLSEISENLKNFSSSLSYYKEYKRLNDQLNNLENKKKITEIESKFEIDKKDKELQLKDLEIQRQDIILYTTIGSTILLFIFAFVFYYQSKLRKNANRTIEEINAKLIDTNKVLEKKSIQIQEQNEKLTELNATKDKFFSILAHDLKNPLGLFLSISNFLSDSYDSINEEEKKNMINNIQSSAKNINTLLENLLQWARSQTGAINCKPEKIDLSILIFEIKYIYAPLADEKGITLSINLEEDLFITSDKNMISTVMRNILSNAIKFTNTGGIISILASKNNGRIYINFKDNGVGIDKNQLDKLFKIDKAFSTSGTNMEKGTGLGLILSYEFLKKNNGNINVISEDGNGSEFIIDLPDGKI